MARLTWVLAVAPLMISRCGDLVVGEALGDQGHHLPLPVGEAGQVGEAGRVLGPGGELLDQAAGDPGRQEGVARHHRPHRPQQLGRLGVLDQEPVGADPDGLEDVLVEVERGQDDDLHVGQPVVLGDAAGGGEAVDAGHADVHEHHVGPQLEGQAHRLVAVGRLARPR